MDYLLSEEGQRIYLAEGNQPARRGINAPWFPKGLKLQVNDPEIGDKFSEYQKQFHEIFSGTAPPS